MFDPVSFLNFSEFPTDQFWVRGYCMPRLLTLTALVKGWQDDIGWMKWGKGGVLSEWKSAWLLQKFYFWTVPLSKMRWRKHFLWCLICFGEVTTESAMRWIQSESSHSTNPQKYLLWSWLDQKLGIESRNSRDVQSAKCLLLQQKLLMLTNSREKNFFIYLFFLTQRLQVFSQRALCNAIAAC